MTAKNKEERMSWLRKAADQGYPPSQDEINKLKSAPEPKPASTSPDDMIAQLKKRAEAGDMIAKIALDSLLSSPLYSPGKK